MVLYGLDTILDKLNGWEYVIIGIFIIVAGILICNAGNNKASTKKGNSKIKQYEICHRPKDGFIDNMNYKLYECKAIYIQTKRRRTVKISAFDEDGVVESLLNSGYTEPFEIKRIPFPEITDDQKKVLGDINFDDICEYDASTILSGRYYGDNSVPNPELLTYATECGIQFSYYIGKKSLYDLIFIKLNLRDRIAFFVFCVYRFTTDDRQGNLNNHPYRNIFYQFSEENITNDRFIKSMDKYGGRDLRFFGKFTINNCTITGGSVNTIAYKTAINFLQQHFALKNRTGKTI